MRELDAAALLEAARRGDQGAWRELVDRYGRLVYAVARSFRLAPQDVDDVFQTAWFRLSEHLDRLRDPERVGSWLATTTRNECLRLLRTNARVTVTDEFDVAVDDGPTVEDEVVLAEQRAAMREAFARLPVRCQQLLVRIIDPESDYQSICNAMDMPIGSIGPTRGRCLERLALELESSYPLHSDAGRGQ